MDLPDALEARGHPCAGGLNAWLDAAWLGDPVSLKFNVLFDERFGPTTAEQPCSWPALKRSINS